MYTKVDQVLIVIEITIVYFIYKLMLYSKIATLREYK